MLEPLVVVTLLVGGTYVNRNASFRFFGKNRRRTTPSKLATEGADIEDFPGSPGSRSSLESGNSADALLNGSQPGSPSLLAVDHTSPWRERELKLWTFRTVVRTPNSRQFKDRWFSRVLRKFPFMQEAFYWALIYWVIFDWHDNSSDLKADNNPGIPARSRIHRSYPCIIDRRRRSPSRSPTHPHRAGARHILGACNPEVLHGLSHYDALDQQNILLHPHSRHDSLPRMAILPHHDAQPHI